MFSVWVSERVESRFGVHEQLAHRVAALEHSLLVDCVVQETGNTSRYELNVEVYAGERYRLVPETGPGQRDCVAVHMESAR